MSERMSHASRTRGLLAAIFICTVSPAVSAAPETAAALEQVRHLFSDAEFAPQPFGPVRWIAGGAAYTTLEPSSLARGAKDLVSYEAASGRREIVVAAAELMPAGAFAPLEIENYAWSADSSKLLVFTHVQQVQGDRSRGDYWVLDRNRKTLRKLGGSGHAAASPLRFATFSPQAEQIAYVRDNDLWVESVTDGTIARLTTDGSLKLTHGVNDVPWTCCKPPSGGFRWSPDGTRIAYWQFDMSSVPEFLMINETDAPYPFTVPQWSPRPGAPTPRVRVGVVSASGGPTVWMNIGDGPDDTYLPRMEWAASSRELILQSLSRSQELMHVLVADASTGEVRTFLEERDSAWVDVIDEWQWLAGGKQLLWVSERDGWRHLYAVSRDSGKIRLLTPGDYDVISVAKVDERGGWIYFVASPDNPTQRRLYRVPLHGGKAERVSPKEATGTNGYDISPDARFAIHTHSSLVSPPAIRLIRLPDHAVVRPLVENERLQAAIVAAHLSERSELFRIAVGEGVELDGWLIRPRNFDPSKKYPLLINVYSEPGRQNAADEWGSLQMQWHRLIADQGYLVASVDNRGTPSPRGRAWRKAAQGALGELSSREQAEAVRALASKRSYVDPTRVAIWGKSGGGSATLNAMFRYPDVYRVGISVASVPDQQLYHAVYQERYMRTPADNPNGYQRGSPINYAEGLKGDLLLIHGSGDDNTHYQGVARLVNRLVELGKPFDLMVYPNRSHCLCEGPGTNVHVYSLMTRYLLDHLPAGGQ